MDKDAADAGNPTPGHSRPNVLELSKAGVLSADLVKFTRGFVGTLMKTSRGRYKFSGDFRTYPQHITDFAYGGAFKAQFNVGFCSQGDEPQWHARVGLGCFISNSFSQLAAGDWTSVVQAILEDPQLFDAMMSRLDAGYAELPNPVANPRAEDVVRGNSNRHNGWRFIGRRISAADLYELNVQEFAELCTQTFDILRSAKLA